MRPWAVDVSGGVEIADGTGKGVDKVKSRASPSSPTVVVGSLFDASLLGRTVHLIVLS